MYLKYIKSFKAFPGLKAGAIQAGITSSSPVCGFFPFLSALFLVSNVPNPTSCIFSPFFNSSVTTSIKAFKDASVSFFYASVCSEIAFTNSLLFIIKFPPFNCFLSFVLMLI